MQILIKIGVCGLILTCAASSVLLAAVPDVKGLLRVECSFERANEEAIVNEALGFVMEADGHLMTTYQTIVDAESGRLSGTIRVVIEQSSGDLTLPAKIIGVEPTLNFAILKVEHEAPLETLVVNHQRELVKGEPVYAFYFDREKGYLPITGSFSALNQLECYQASLTDTMLRTEIKLPAGSIGAPILDGEGHVFAMHTAHVVEPEEDGIEFEPDEIHLLSMKLAMNIYDSLKQRRSRLSPWTGFSVRGLTDEESAQFPLMKRQVRCGIAIEYVWPGGPADEMGIQSGDILYKFSHYSICSVADFQRWLYMYGVGQEVTLYLVRDAKERVILDYTVEQRPGWATPR